MAAKRQGYLQTFIEGIQRWIGCFDATADKIRRYEGLMAWSALSDEVGMT